MSHILYYPTQASPTRTETLHPAFLTIQDEEVTPFQRLLTASDGTQYVFTLSSNLAIRYEMQFVDYPDANFTQGGVSFTGLQSLRTFFQSYTSWAGATFQLSHDDSYLVTVRLASLEWHFIETLKNRWSGTLYLMNSL
jgi:hypothetical protein